MIHEKLFSIVYVTCPNITIAETLASLLLEKRAVACVNIIPNITSLYTWEGKLVKETEVLMMMKTREEKLDEIKQLVRQNHPYEVPEIISVKINDGSPSYLSWVSQCVSGE